MKSRKIAKILIIALLFAFVFLAGFTMMELQPAIEPAPVLVILAYSAFTLFIVTLATGSQRSAGAQGAIKVRQHSSGLSRGL